VQLVGRPRDALSGPALACAGRRHDMVLVARLCRPGNRHAILSASCSHAHAVRRPVQCGNTASCLCRCAGVPLQHETSHMNKSLAVSVLGTPVCQCLSMPNSDSVQGSPRVVGDCHRRVSLTRTEAGQAGGQQHRVVRIAASRGAAGAPHPASGADGDSAAWSYAHGRPAASALTSRYQPCSALLCPAAQPCSLAWLLCSGTRYLRAPGPGCQS